MEKLYQPKIIESIVQKHWEQEKTFTVKEDPDKKKYYCLSMIPYPSGHLHIGHVRNYTIGDVISRYQRLLGKNVLQPIGWDAFGLPAERAAIKHQMVPASWTYSNICYMKQQLKLMGFAYDWSREIITCQPEYYRWEQWFFIILYQRGLVYKKLSLVNWCPQDQTVLANEQVINNCCWRCNTKIQYKKIPQWFIKITKYADQLLYDLNTLKDWPQQVKIMQKNWIGRSEGIEISFKILHSKNFLKVYTTRPDTIMGVTYLAIAINHPLAIKIAIQNSKINKYLKTCNKMFDSNKFDVFSYKEIQGIYTEIHAIHPINNKKLPIWISNTICTSYGTGAIMGVPAHNQEDLKFANQYRLPIKPVILDIKHEKPKIDNHAMTHKGILFNSGEFNGLNSQEAYIQINKKLIQNGVAKPKVCYRIQDWCVSRQRYWGTPIPMITLKNGNITPVPIEQLPVILPENVKIFDMINPLRNKDWMHIVHENSTAIREVDTFDTFMESSWYYARYTCPHYKSGMLSSHATNYWLPIDQYIGGIEHATMHLIYFRFYHKLMRDIGLVNSNEPAKRLLCQGMVLSDAFYYINQDSERVWVSPLNIKIKRNKTGKIIKAIDLKGNNLVHFGMVKMSKSKNNGIDPQVIIQKYGADTMRLFIMFAAPTNMPLEWKETSIIGIHRFLKRLWKLVYEHIQNGPIEILNLKNLNKRQRELRRKIHKTIEKVTDDIDRRQMFNTAISSIMELSNYLMIAPKKEQQDRALLHEGLLSMIRMLYPFTPHITFILWKKLGQPKNIDDSHWPEKDKTAFIDDTKIIIVQINGKVRHRIIVPYNIDQNKIENILLKNNSFVLKYLKNKKIIKIIYVQNKLINLVTQE